MNLSLRYVSILAAVVAAMVSYIPASAQTNEAQSKLPVFHARFGWDEKAVPSCWNPITITVTGGSVPFQGALAITYQQDSSQSARVIVPVTVMPGQEIPVEALGFFAPRPEKISINLLSNRGRSLSTINYVQFPRKRNERQLQDTLDEREGLILAIGKTSIRTAAKAWRPDDWKLDAFPDTDGDYFNRGNRREVTLDEVLAKAWQRLTVANVRPQDLSTSWAAYEPAVAIVVHADEAQSADPRALAALYKWVQSGGRLVILADQPGPYWRAWLPGENDPVELFAQAQVPTGPELSVVVKPSPDSDENDDPDSTEAQSESQEEAPSPVALNATVSGRAMRLTEQAVQNGWSLQWRADPTDSHTTGLMAQGPIGFGWVTIIGIDPKRVPATLSDEMTAAVWQDALTVGLDDWINRSSRQIESYSASSYYNYEPEWRRAELAVLGALGDFNIAGAGMFILIAVGVAVLGFLLGPFDGIMLKRWRISHRSWLTALGWISIASVLAYVGPRLFRAGSTSVDRLEVIDILAQEPQTLAWQTGLMGIFAATSGKTRLENVDQSAYWRGLSASRPIYWQRDEIALPTITTIQANAQAGEQRPGNPINDLSLATWTFRAMTDNGLTHSPISAAIQRDEHDVQLTINGIADPKSIKFAAIQFSDGWLHIQRLSEIVSASKKTDGLPLAITLETDLIKFKTPSALDTIKERDPDESFYGYGDPVPFNPGIGFSLAGPATRTLAIDRRVHSGNWAALYLRLKTRVPSITIDHEKPDYDTDQIFRILVPVSPLDVPVTPSTEPSP